MTDDAKELEKLVGEARGMATQLSNSRAPRTVADAILFKVTRAVELLAKRCTEAGDPAAKLSTALETLNDEPCGKPYPTEDAGMPGMRCCRRKGHASPHADCIGGDGFECVDPEHHGEPTKEPPGTFSDELVNRLAKSAWEWSPKFNGATPYEYVNDAVQSNMRRTVEKILSELAKMRPDWPSEDELRGPNQMGPNDNGIPGIAALLRDRIAPILAAKDAEISGLRIEHDKWKAFALDTSSKRGVADARIAELESRTPANECSNAERVQYEKTIELQKQRIAELETFRSTVASATPFAENDDIVQHAADVVSNIEGRTYRKAFYEKTVPELRARITELEKQLAERDPTEALHKIRAHVRDYGLPPTTALAKSVDDAITKFGKPKNDPAGRVCGTCNLLEGAHYDPNAKAITCRMFKERSDQREA